VKLKGEGTADSPFQYGIHKPPFCGAEPILVPPLLSSEVGKKYRVNLKVVFSLERPVIDKAPQQSE
jgi:hypothetical protein